LLHLVGINSFEYMTMHGLTNPKNVNQILELWILRD